MFAYAIAISGGIATGKSTFANELRNRGYFVVDADKISADILKKNEQKVIQFFGKKVLTDEVFDKRKFSNLVFSNLDYKKWLEAWISPMIKEKIFNTCKIHEKNKKPYFVDMPLYYEKKEIYPFAHNVLIYAPVEAQIERLSRRNSFLTEEQIIQRISSQMNIEEKRKIAEYVIYNLENNLDIFNEDINKLILVIDNWYP